MFLSIYTEGCICASGCLVVKVSFIVGGILFGQVTRASGWSTSSQYKYSPGTTDGTWPKTLTWPLKHLSSWSSWMLCNGTAERTEAHGPHDPKNPPPVSCCPLPGDTRTHRSRVHSCVLTMSDLFWWLSITCTQTLLSNYPPMFVLVWPPVLFHWKNNNSTIQGIPHSFPNTHARTQLTPTNAGQDLFLPF